MKRRGAFYQLAYHFVWATKKRLPLITPAVEERLWPYLRAKGQDLGYVLHAANGTPDHIHILIELAPTVLVSDVAKNLKGASSHYINKQSGLSDTLYWQDGYGVVTLRKAEIPKVARYIQRQKEHHRTGKLSQLLEQTGID
jgi:putative transposase